MDTDAVSGVDRLRTAGIGVVLGGVIIGIGHLVLPIWVLSVGLAGLGIAIASADRRPMVIQFGIGVLAVGAIALVEERGYGLGLEPLTLAIVAIAFGILDVVISLGLGWLRARLRRT